ncbi:MAG TPA: helix-turn-helix transcriptional regulator [Vicingaceae bacterium]
MVRENNIKLFILIGRRLKELRKSKGYSSQETFAYDAEIPRALYGKYEKGANLTIASLFRIIKFHGLTFEDFFSKGFDELFEQ